MNRYVLDTNVYFSFLYNAKLIVLIDWIFNKNLEIYISETIIYELIKNAQGKHLFEKAKITKEELRSLLLSFTILHKSKLLFNGSPHINDDFLFALCIEKKCSLVTGDKKLLEWKNSPVDILSLKTFKELMEKQDL